MERHSLLNSLPKAKVLGSDRRAHSVVAWNVATVRYPPRPFARETMVFEESLSPRFRLGVFRVSDK